MDSAASGLDFAVIGHQDSMQNIADFINGIRTADQEKLSDEKIKDIFSFIPPRSVFKMKVRSITGSEVEGIYIETFIDPDKLEPHYNNDNIQKVLAAMDSAKKTGARIATMGGFTSIVLNGNVHPFSQDKIKFTTGNTLTSAFIVKGIEKAAIEKGIDLSSSNVLIIGATGDIGMACINYLKHKVNKLLLCARNIQRLESLVEQLEKENIPLDHSTDIQHLVPDANIIICVASTTGIKLHDCQRNVLICDAGYPKNMETGIESLNGFNLFHGGMGQISGGYHLYPDYSETFYRYPGPYTSHGCILEAIVLAFEGRYESYSAGRGNIPVDRLEEIYEMSLRHGITLAPFYNSEGLWKT